MKKKSKPNGKVATLFHCDRELKCLFKAKAASENVTFNSLLHRAMQNELNRKYAS